MADVGDEAAPAAGPDDQGQGQNEPQPQRAPPAARNNRGSEGNGGNGGGGTGTRDPLINMRDRLFHTLFYRLTLTYARAFPKSVRRLLETLILIKVCFHAQCRL